MLTSAGIGSGLDINKLVSDLVNAESAPKVALFDKQEALLTAKISGYGLLKSALSDLKSALTTLNTTSTYNNRSATASDKTKFTATSTTAAVLGNYAIQISQLAAAHKLSSTGYATSATVVGTGSLTLTSGSNSFTLTINDSNKTLAGIRDAINSASTNTSITATVINVDNGTGGTESRLVLTAKATGTANAIKVTAVNGGEGNLQQLVYDPAPGSGVTNLVPRNAALNAVLLIDGQTVTRSSNTVSDAIDGVTLTLLKADVGVTHTLDISVNTKNVSTAVSALVDSYNKYITSFNSITAYSEKGSGTLLGDAIARSVSSQVRQILTGSVASITSSGNNSLANLGITTNKDGSLKLNSVTLDSVIANDMATVTSLFTANDGIAKKLDKLLTEYTKSSGILDTKTNSINGSIADITRQRGKHDLRMQTFQKSLLDQFVFMDSIVQQLTKTGSYLTQALAGLPKPNSVKS